MALKIVFPILFLLSTSCSLIAQKPEAIKEYNSGLQYYNMHNYQSAIPFFESAVKKDPAFVYAYRCLISCHEQEGDLKISAELYEKVVLLSPSDKTVCYNLAMTYIDLKDYKKAVLNLKKALVVDPAYLKASSKLKEIEEYLKKQAEKNNEKQPQANSEENQHSAENSTYSSALHLYKKENYEACLSKLNNFNRKIQNPDFYYLKAITYQHLGDREKAVLAYEKTLELDDRHFNTNLNLGTIFYNDKNFEEAVHLFETAYLRRKNDMKLLYNLAKAHFYAKEYKEAIPYLETYLDRNYNKGEAWTLLGDAYSKTGKSKNAAKAYEEAKKHGGDIDHIADHLQNNIAEFGRKASEYTQNGNYQKAIEVLEQAISEHSEKASLHFNLGLNYMEIGNTKKAREEFKKTIDLEPAHAKAYQGLALIYYERQEFKEAAAYYLATVDAGKHDQFVYYKLGSCYFKLKRYLDAANAYQEAIVLNPEEKQYFFGLGLSFLALDKNYKSIDALEKALDIDPEFFDAQYHVCVNLIKISQFEKCITEAEKLLKKNDQYAKAYLVIGHAHNRLGNYVLANEFQKKAERLDPTLKQ